MKRGSVNCRSIKVLFLGATEAGKTALVAALRGEELPDEEDRSIATRMHKMRMVYNAGAGVFETVPLDELRLERFFTGHEGEENVKGDEDEGDAGPSTFRSFPAHNT